jgi:glutamate racemase
VTIGIFDSGVGGLTVARRVRELLPAAGIVYFADQRHVPYGDRSIDDLRALLARNVAFLVARGVDAIAMGCNTSCAVAARYGWPDAPVPVLDLIAAAAGAVAASGARRVGVVATTATASSGAYGNAIRARVPVAEVLEVAAPALVPLVEAGVRGRAAQEAVAAACAGLPGKVDAVVLACSHYPLLDAEFAAVFGERVVRIDPAIAQAGRVAAWAGERASAAAPQPDRYFTNGALDAFRRQVAAVMGPQAAVAAASSDDVEDVEEQHDGHRAERTAGDDLQHGVRL